MSSAYYENELEKANNLVHELAEALKELKAIMVYIKIDKQNAEALAGAIEKANIALGKLVY